jgi:hypothetical protein
MPALNANRHSPSVPAADSPRRIWVPADARENPAAMWRPRAPWSTDPSVGRTAQSAVLRPSTLPGLSGIIFVQALMLWLLIQSI